MSTQADGANLVRLVYPRDESYAEWRDDLDRMRKVLNERGYDASDRDLYDCWVDHSDTYAASWLWIGNDDAYLFSVLARHLSPVSEPDASNA